ncbi:hypothetical protein, partial [Bradyrhizobium jicamae]|uniref:hypothetical protein n=1 Tax=Bradyrhizobium jicamae TaxID=280332 RepID=UPI001BAA5FDE
VGVSQPDPTGELPVTTAKPPARYGALWGARPGGFALPSYTITRDTTFWTCKDVPAGQLTPLDAIKDITWK